MATRGDPVRWLSPDSDAPEELRRVLSSAQDDGGGQNTIASLAAKLPLAPPATVSAPALGSAAKKAILSWKLAVWVAGAAAAGGAVTNLVVLAPNRPAITAPVQGISAAAPPAGEGPPSSADSAERDLLAAGQTGSPGLGAPEPPAPAATETGSYETGTLDRHGLSRAPIGTGNPLSSRASSEEPALDGGARRRRGEGGEPPSHAEQDSLGAEARLLLEAKRDMARDPQRALRAAEAHDSAFADGALAEEREVLRIEALVRLGKHDEAAQVAASFRARHPQSSHLARIERLLRSRP